MGEGEGSAGAAREATSGRQAAAISGSQEKAIAEEWDLCSGLIYRGQVGVTEGANVLLYECFGSADGRMWQVEEAFQPWEAARHFC